MSEVDGAAEVAPLQDTVSASGESGSAAVEEPQAEAEPSSSVSYLRRRRLEFLARKAVVADVMRERFK
jgi:hypothetical protein